MELAKELSVAKGLAVEAGRSIMEIYNGDLEIKYKGQDDPVTKADLVANEIINAGLKKFNYGILSEESINDRSNLRKDKIWIVDPLDGTLDFIQKTGEFAVMIGLIKSGRPILGVIYLPVFDQLFTALAGQGAYRKAKGSWERIKVNNIGDFENLKVQMSRNHISTQEKNFLNNLGVKSYNSLGSCMKVLDIAAGHSDLYFTFTDKIKLWDTCASDCLIHEAGGKMTDIYGKPLQYDINKLNHSNGVLASNYKIHSKLVKIIKKYKKGSDDLIRS